MISSPYKIIYVYVCMFVCIGIEGCIYRYVYICVCVSVCVHKLSQTLLVCFQFGAWGQDPWSFIAKKHQFNWKCYLQNFLLLFSVSVCSKLQQFQSLGPCVKPFWHIEIEIRSPPFADIFKFNCMKMGTYWFQTIIIWFEHPDKITFDILLIFSAII